METKSLLRKVNLLLGASIILLVLAVIIEAPCLCLPNPPDRKFNHRPIMQRKN